MEMADIERLRTLAGDGLDGRWIARAMGRSTNSIYSMASKSGIRIGADDLSLSRKALAGGVALIREEIGGSIGIRWACAHRSGDPLNSRFLERIYELGYLKAKDGVFLSA